MQKFDFQFLDAIRDVERDMFSGRNTLLRDVLDFFMDYDIKKDTDKDTNAKIVEIKSLKERFATDADILLQTLQERLGHHLIKQILILMVICQMLSYFLH